MAHSKFACPCCKNYTYNQPPDGDYSICTVCYWEDDPYQAENPDDGLGANPIPLKTAQLNYKDFGACDRDMLKNVRKPTTDELPENN